MTVHPDFAPTPPFAGWSDFRWSPDGLVLHGASPSGVRFSVGEIVDRRSVLVDPEGNDLREWSVKSPTHGRAVLSDWVVAYGGTAPELPAAPSFAEQVRVARVERGWSQEELGRRCGLGREAQGVIAGVERGFRPTRRGHLRQQLDALLFDGAAEPSDIVDTFPRERRRHSAPTIRALVLAALRRMASDAGISIAAIAESTRIPVEQVGGAIRGLQKRGMARWNGELSARSRWFPAEAA